MTELIVLVLIFIVSLVLVFRNFDLAVKVLLVLSVFLHKEVFSVWRWDLLPVRFFMVAVGIYGIVKFIRWFFKHRDFNKLIQFVKDPFISFLLAIWFVRGVSIIFTKNLSASILLFGFFSTIVIFGILLYQNLRDKPEKILNLIKNYITISFFLVLFGFFQMYLYTQHEIIIGALWNVPGHIARIGSTFWDVNHFAALLASLMPVLGVLILTEGPFKKRAYRTVAFFIMTGMLFLTSSRTSWIIAAVSLMVFVTLLLIKYFGKKGIYFLLTVIFLVSALALYEYSDRSSPFRAYVKSNFHYRLDSFASHIMLLKGSYQIFEEYPILGGGYGGFFEHFRKTDISSELFSRDPAALNTRVPAHTIWGEAMAETGVIGLASFIVFASLLLFTMLYGFFNADNEKNKLLSGAMFGTLVGILTAGIFYSYNSEFFWIILFLYFFFAVSILPPGKVYTDVYNYFIRKKGFYFWIILIISATFIFTNLGKNHLIPWDEAIYAKIAKNMVAKGEYFNMYWKDMKIWFEKPPFYMWSMAAVMNLIGISSLAVRLPSAVFGFGTVLLTFSLARKYFGRFAAYLSSLALLLGVHFLYYSRAAMTDVTTTFFVTLSIYIYLSTKEKNKQIFWFLVGGITGLAILTKGVIGILPLAIILITELITNFKSVFKSESIANYLIMFIGAFLVAAPWHIIQYIRFGQEFIDNYFLYHVVSRATSAIEDKGQPFFWYFTVMKVSMRIWFIPLLVAFPYFVYKSVKKQSQYYIFTVWFTFVFLLFSSSASKIIWYIMPIYPVAAIMVGSFLSDLYTEVIKKINIRDSELLRLIFLFITTVVSLMYFFYNRSLVYTSDTTGSVAKLLQLKDERFGIEELVYVDRVELPIVMYYTDGPYSIIDYDPGQGRYPKKDYDKRIIIISKTGRYSDSKKYYGKKPQTIKEDGDYILIYYESDLRDDRDRIRDLQSKIKTLSSDVSINALEIEELTNQKTELEVKVKPYIKP